MTYLLDVNVLIALFDRVHTHHQQAQNWFGSSKDLRVATCPIVQNGFLRILGNKKYGAGLGSPLIAAESLKSLINDARHVFWPDAISLLDCPLVDEQKLGAHGTLTDTYLLALAAHNKGKLATFDRRLLTSAVKDGGTHVALIGAV
jgi:uncharacterized protein